MVVNKHVDSASFCFPDLPTSSVTTLRCICSLACIVVVAHGVSSLLFPNFFSCARRSICVLCYLTGLVQYASLELLGFCFNESTSRTLQT